MKRKHPAIAITLLVAAAFLVSAQDKPTLHLGATVRSAVFGDFVGAATTFQNGFRPEWDPRQTWLRLYDSNGKIIRTNEVTLPGAESVLIRSVDVGRSGLVAVAASALSSDGAEAGALVLFDKPGLPRLVIRTSPFIPTLIAVAADGYIWVAGTDPKVEFWIRPPATPEQKQGLYVLQKYTSNGILLGSFLKRSAFDAKVLPWHGFLRASAGGLGLFVRHDDGSGEWVELSLEGDVTGRWTVAAPAEGVRLEKMGFTDSGSVYAEWRSNGHPPGAGTYHLNKATSRWDKLEEPQIQSPRGARLKRAEFLGTDGDHLIFRTSRSPSHVVWFQEPPR